MDKYEPQKIEPKWQKYWEKYPELFAANDSLNKKKQYILDMFPYPSGDGLHVGHVESYTATDIVSRYLRMNGKNILHPTGWDAFGLPAENYAIKTKIHPAITTQKAIATFKDQMKKLGLSYDWSREVDSSNPGYYKWTQWFFLLLYKNGLAYRAKAKVNYCPECQTVLANEQVISGKCERCESEVVQKDLKQWFFKITDFIEDNSVEARPPCLAGRQVSTKTTQRGRASIVTSGLLSGLDKVDWPESTKAAQRNWIGKSEGAIIKFKVQSSKFKVKEDYFLEVFTTRLDTIYGCTYCVVAPEHPIVASLLKIKNQKSKIKNIEEIKKYVIQSQNKTELERMGAKDKTGVEIKGIKVINPFTNEEIPVFVADYVLGHYGTGAVMAVPAHDQRDYDFAKHYNLPIKQVIIPVKDPVVQNSKFKIQNDNVKFKNDLKAAFEEDGVLINSEKFTNLTSAQAREETTKWLEKNNLGSRKINYKLRDWLVSRQRYWGAPIPIIYCDKCASTVSAQANIIPVPEKDLPVELPGDVDFNPTGESPLVHSKKFHNVKCPICGAKARRESDTMDTFVCSSWYYFRYADPKNEKEFASKALIKKWLPVDLYIGGADHAVLHLLYSRFFTKVLYKLGYINFDEPFLKLRHQGTILGEDNFKMSKSRGNIVNPDDIIKEYGADILRCFEMFMSPLEDMKPWNTKGIVGIKRFLEKVWKLQGKIKNQKSKCKMTMQNSKVDNILHKTIKKVTEDIKNLRFNTAISQMMIMVNEMEGEKNIPITNYELLITILSPFAPHISEELWSKLGHKESILKERWPEYNPDLTKDEEIDLVIQVNGRVRDTIKVNADISEDEAKKLALKSEKVKKFTEGKDIKKTVFIKGKLINLVA